MMPADEDAFIVTPGGNVCGELIELAVFELIADLKMKGLAERFDGEAWTMALLGIRRGVKGIEQQRFGINAEGLEVRYISFRALMPGRGKISTRIRFLGVTDDEDNGVFRGAKVCDGSSGFSRGFREAGDWATQRQQCAG